MKGFRTAAALGILYGTLPLQAQPAIVTEPESQTRPPGAVVLLRVTAAGSEPLQYRWQFNGTDINGAHGRTLRLFATPSRAGTYRAIVRDSSGQERSSAPAQVEVKRRPRVSVQPLNTKVPLNGTAVFNVELTDAGPYRTMVWHNSNPLEGSHVIPDGLGFDVHSTRLEIPDCFDTDPYNGLYWLAITNDVGGTTSRRARLTVVSPPFVTRHPVDRTVRAGGTAVFNFVLARDEAPRKTFQWQKDGQPIPGANARLLRVPRAQAADEGLYNCVITSMGGTTESGGGFLRVLP